MKKSAGTKGFTQDYWDKNYSEPHEMDGLANAKEHAHYVKAFFDLDQVDISSVIDFGFGLGHLFEAMTKSFTPYRAFALEPSEYAFSQFKKRYQKPEDSMKLTLKKWDLVFWCKEQKPRSKHFDLGICTSVFQYLSDEEVAYVLPIMASQCKYLYFSVPTDVELKRQVSELDFFDEYAKRRTKEFYRECLSPYFTVIGTRLLESKKNFDEQETSFKDYLFRYD
jgi:hypothetical protein